MSTPTVDSSRDDPLTTDLPCAQCHYNLRTKKPSELCPECAHPVALSIRRRQQLRETNFRQLHFAATLLIALALLQGLHFLSLDYLFPGHIPRLTAGNLLGATVSLLASLVESALTFAAILLLSRSSPHPDRHRILLYAFLAYPLLILLGDCLLQAIHLFDLPNFVFYSITNFITWMFIYKAVLCVAALVFLRNLADRLDCLSLKYAAVAWSCTCILAALFLAFLTNLALPYDSLLLSLVDPFGSLRAWLAQRQSAYDDSYWIHTTSQFLFWLLFALFIRRIERIASRSVPPT